MYIVEFSTEISGGNEIHWVTFARSMAHSLKSTTVVRVSEVKPRTDEAGNVVEPDPSVIERWEIIGPAYKAWIEGGEIPQDGTPLTAWPALNADQVKAFRAASIPSVEDVAAMNDVIMSRVGLPGIMQLKQLAGEFLAAREVVDFAAERAAMQAQMEALQEQIEGMKAEKPKRGPGRPKKDPEAAADDAA